MGTTAHLAVDAGHAELLEPAVARLHDLAARWTRFDPASELGRINAATGAPVVVSLDTARLVEAALDAWRRTDGRFDPSTHDALVAAGYDRTFADGPGPGGPAHRAPGVADVQVDTATGVVVVPAEVRLDFGGIGKGYAADVLVDGLRSGGATGAAVTIGGDARVDGECPFAAGWPIHTAESTEPIAHLAAGGFCFSTTRKRRWIAAGEERHHIIDPRTGRPAGGGVADVAVAAASATVAEIHATAAVVAGMPDALTHLTASGLDGFVVDDAGTHHRFGVWDQSPSISSRAADGGSRE
ncbi:MAG: FAD:protein FMN transferase [Actinomycetota bacterium]